MDGVLIVKFSLGNLFLLGEGFLLDSSEPTNALHELDEGTKVGIRGPFGNSFPMDDYKGKNIIIIGGGIGMAPLHPVINTIVDHRDDYGELLIINGARSPQDLVFKDEFTVEYLDANQVYNFHQLSYYAVGFGLVRYNRVMANGIEVDYWLKEIIQ